MSKYVNIDWKINWCFWKKLTFFEKLTFLKWLRTYFAYRRGTRTKISIASGLSKKWCKTLPKYTTSIGFLLKSEKLMNFINFLTFNGNPMEVEYFGRVLHHFLPMPPTLGELISKQEWFFWSRFFCASMSRPIVNRKNCLGDAAMVYNTENDLNYFSSQIFPEASIHLPGERELPPVFSSRNRS